MILEADFVFPTPEGEGYLQDTLEYQRVPERVIGTADFEKMRDLPTNSQDYQLGRKVGVIGLQDQNDPNLFHLWCPGFLVGPDLFMTNHHFTYNDFGLYLLTGAAIFMDYYQELSVDPTAGGLTARVSEVVHAQALKDYALLRLDKPIGDTYGWLKLDTTTGVNTNQSVKVIQHPYPRSKEIVQKNSQIVGTLADYPFILAYLADVEGGSSGAPVFLKDGTGVIAIHHSSWTSADTGEPLFSAGSLMSYIGPEIQQWLPGGTVAPPARSDLVVAAPQVSKATLGPSESFTLSATVRNQGNATSQATTLRFYRSTDTVITRSDVEVGTAVVSSLAPSGASKASLTRAAPTAMGTYYYGACVDAVADEDVTDNNCSAAVTVTVSVGFSPRTIMDQTFEVGSPVALTLPVAMGGEVPYIYTLSPIPEGLDFAVETRQLVGIPTRVGTTEVTYTATDATGVSAFLIFTIKVADTSGSDVDGDGQVMVVDLVIVALFYGTQVPDGLSLPADVNADGVVNILDLTAVAQGIDAGRDGNGLSMVAVEAALGAAAEQAEDLEEVVAAPMHFSPPAYLNVTNAFADARHLAISDVLSAFLELLAEMAEIPETTALLPNYPNPFNPETWIPYYLATDAPVILTIYDTRGVAVRELMLGHQPAGVYVSRGRAAYWDGRNQHGEQVASGVYFYTLTVGDFTATRKLLIAK